MNSHRICRLAICLAVCLIASLSLAQPQVPVQHLNAPTPSVGRRPGPVSLLIEKSYVRALVAEVEPTRTVHVSLRSGDALMISLGPSRFELGSGMLHSPLQLDDGGMEVVKGGHDLLNTSGSTVRLLEVQIPRGIDPDHPVCGLGGPACSGMHFGKTDQGTYSEGMIFETRTIKVTKAELGPGGVLETHHDDNDHVIVSLTAADLDVGGLEAQHAAGDAYLYRGSPVIVNRGQADARLVIVELK